MSRTYTPDNWVLVEITSPEGINKKVLAGWGGGYLTGDSWKLSSGVTKIVDVGEAYEIHNHSGSVYICRKSSERMSGYLASIFHSLEKSATKSGSTHNCR